MMMTIMARMKKNENNDEDCVTGASGRRNLCLPDDSPNSSNNVHHGSPNTTRTTIAWIPMRERFKKRFSVGFCPKLFVASHLHLTEKKDLV